MVRLDGFPHGSSIRLCYFPAFFGQGRLRLYMPKKGSLQLFASERIQIVMGQAQCKLMADSNAAGFFFRGFVECFCDQNFLDLNTYFDAF